MQIDGIDRSQVLRGSRLHPEHTDFGRERQSMADVRHCSVFDLSRGLLPHSGPQTPQLQRLIDGVRTCINAQKALAKRVILLIVGTAFGHRVLCLRRDSLWQVADTVGQHFAGQDLQQESITVLFFQVMAVRLDPKTHGIE